MSIKDSLAKLDPANDEHWTDDGLPRMDVLQALPGNSRLTRKQVTDADPSFSRASVMDAEKVDPDTDKVDVEIEAETKPERGDSPEVMVEAQEPTGGEIVAEAATLPEVPEITTQAPEMAVAPVLTEMQALQASLAVHEEAMLAADRVKEAADKTMKISSDAVNAINRKIEVLVIADPQAATAGIRDYIEMQNKLRIDRAMKAKRFMGNSGAKPGDVAKALEVRSPLDKAHLGRKPPRGSQRPPARGMIQARV